MTIPESSAPVENKFTSSHVARILQQRSWHGIELTTEQCAWCEHAATLLGPQSADVKALETLLSFVFHYDPQEILARTESHAALSRYAAREALRQLASLLLEPVPLDSDRLREIVGIMKSDLEIPGRELFHMLRLSLAGSPGEGELDRVILLIDEAAAANFAAPVKSVRTRVIEFCSALD